MPVPINFSYSVIILTENESLSQARKANCNRGNYKIPSTQINHEHVTRDDVI